MVFFRDYFPEADRVCKELNAQECQGGRERPQRATQEQRQGDVNVSPTCKGIFGCRRNGMAGQCPMTSVTSALSLTPGAIHPKHILSHLWLAHPQAACSGLSSIDS